MTAQQDTAAQSVDNIVGLKFQPELDMEKGQTVKDVNAGYKW